MRMRAQPSLVLVHFLTEPCLCTVLLLTLFSIANRTTQPMACGQGRAQGGGSAIKSINVNLMDLIDWIKFNRFDLLNEVQPC